MPGGGAKLLQSHVGRMVNFGPYRIGRQEPPYLIQRHALSGEHVARDHHIGFGAENVVLGESSERLELGCRRGLNRQGIEDHHNARYSAERLVLLSDKLDAQRPVGLQRFALLQQNSPFVAVQVHQIFRQRKGLRVRTG